jgi:DNA-binding NarL/FixJ family response regulator
MKPNIIIADDHPFSRIGVKHHLAQLDLAETIYEADNGLSVMNLLSNNRVNIVFLDVKMPVMDGLETATMILKQYPRVRVVMLSMFNEEALIINLIKIGVDGYILKDDKNLEEALITTVKGNYYFSADIEPYCERAKEETYQGKPVTLTPREEKLLPLIARGKNSQEIARELSLSKFTVESYRKELLAKFDLSNSTALVDFAHRTGLL